MANQNLDLVVEGGGSGFKDTKDYEKTEAKSEALIKKYKEMAEMRRDYEDIDIRDCIPTLNEMIQEDMMYEILEDASNGKTEQEVLSTAYYTDAPPTFELGYDKDKGVFIFKIQNLTFTKADKELNRIDGDTFRVPLKNVIQSSTDTSINFGNGESYTDFRDYCYKKGLVNKNASEDKQLLQVRLICIDCPEIPHFDVMPLKKDDIVKMTVKEAKKKGAYILKYNYSNGKVTERTDLDEEKEFYKVKGKKEWHEIVGDGSRYVDDKIKDKDGNVIKDIVYKKIVVYDDSKKSSLAGGYKAKENLIKQLEGNTVYVMLDANGIKANKTAGKYKLYYNHWWNAKSAISDMIDQWCSYSNDSALVKLSYSPFGTDGYGRFIGAAYAKNGDLFTNVAKYNIADSETKSIANKDFTGSPELSAVGGDNSAAFQPWTYDKNNQIWLDSFTEMTKESYNLRLDFHKQVTGIDFTAFRNCTLMIGDTLFLIPPQNIRSLSSIDYEKVGIMRGKGSMVKNNTNREMFLEVDLYFYNGDGVNGIAKEVVMPSGDKVIYYMNGLRSLIAQFKLAPYLPIENQFINDVLNIEAVSLVNLNVSTVEGFPRLLRATLTMRDFNYRIYMPDVPIDYSSNQVSEIAEMNPIFAKCFHWELFRYYYQRMIFYGNAVKDYGYNTREYNKEIYSRRDILQPAWFCEKDGFDASGIEFYIPDENWLKAALSIKKDEDFYGQQLIPTELTNASKEWIGWMNDSALAIELISDKSITDVARKLLNNTNIKLNTTKDGAGYKNCLVNRTTVLVSNNSTNVFKTYLEPILKPFVQTFASTDAVTNVSVDEIVSIKNMTLTYNFNITLRTQHLSTIDIAAIKEVVRDALSMDTTNNIFKNGKLVCGLQFKLKANGSSYVLDTAYLPTLSADPISSKNEKITDLDILTAFAKKVANKDNSSGTATTNDTLAKEYDYLDPSAMKFVRYNINPIELDSLSFSLTNNFSDITLKIMDGFAPQYMGSSDATIEISFTTSDLVNISMVNNLPAHAANIGKLYRRILSCWPIKVRNHYLQLAGINEVLIDLVEIQNLEGFPGFYEVRMRMTSVDRTMRQRETMKQLESDQKTTTKASDAINSYWDFDNILSTAEVYPDLDLPPLAELSKFGLNFIKYKNTKQLYPDPDFYMIYNFPFTSYIIKKNLKDTFYNQIFHDEGKDKSELLDDTNYEFFDQMGMTLYRKLDPYTGTTEGIGREGKSQNALADFYDEELAAVDEKSQTNIKRSAKEELKELKDRNCADLTDLLIYLTACDVQQGWTLKPGFTAPVVVNELNLAIEDLDCSGLDKEAEKGDNNHAYAKEIFDLRAETIKAIDDYLSSPIDWSLYNVSSFKNDKASEYESSSGDVINKVAELFATEAKGRKILQLLNPFETAWKTVKRDDQRKEDKKKYDGYGDEELDETYESPQSAEKKKEQGYDAYGDELDDYTPPPTAKEKEEQGYDPYGDEKLPSEGGETDESKKDWKNYNNVFMVDYFVGFLYSAAKCISAEKMFDDTEQKIAWEPRQFRLDDEGFIDKDKEGNMIPNCKIEDNGKSIRQAESLKEALEKGKQWGMYQIKLYRGSELKKIMQPKSRVTYLSEEEMPMYKDPKTGKERWHSGFIDPYYNIAGYRSKAGKEYIEKIATNQGHNTIAFIRVMLMHLRRMIIDGMIFSELDVIARDYNELKETIKIEPDKEDFDSAAEVSAQTMYDDGGIFGLPGLMMEQGFLEGIKTYFTFANVKENTQVEAIAGAVGSEEAAGTIKELIDNLPATYKRSFCSRLILPVLMATLEGSSVFDDLIKQYRLAELNNLTVGSIITTSEPMSMIAKYCRAMNSIGMLEFDAAKTDPETTSDSQKLWNYIMKEAYTKLSDDPQAYVLHSYYDMLINDKRGRLVRAFPTYYVLFIDEGRKIGSWKLFDNFYNMNAISEITVSKSRKIPADTCSFVMSNMYTSYAAEYDNTTRQQYVDTYGLRDVFHSIFCPEAYVKKEDAIRRRKQIGDTAVLQPGVRIHVRMGYGSDASRLPIAFNGKIAEIEVSEVVQVIAQGDGHELYNPLNALGDIDAVELSEAQGWFTMLKDIRGSMKRGGESPRTLLAKLLTAKHGGVKKAIGHWISKGRWYADNPFGICHFGDNRFNYIFSEGETVQNLYEVCDASLLKGTNELYESRENSMATPTINTTIQDKTFWDILQLCANSGINYSGAIRDFGLRSTICLCKPNHYYAYAYKKIDDEDGQTEGKIVERRKPFQQFHYYDSYTDIVYNSIKASEKNMKTNAVGIWESTDLIWGKSQSTVGPIYLDMNIYPEYQKSMTVDTGLVSDGAGGLELNFFTHFSENWASDANDNKVNKALAERVTTNVLRESVSNMYCGELCVLGDISIKPHDRFYINDYYEDMMGTMEVEAVVYSMNSATGFTTTIYPDCIVRAEDNHEVARQIINGTMAASLVLGVGGRIGVIHTLARLDSSLVSALGKLAAGYAASPLDEVVSASVLGSLFKIDKIDDLRGLIKSWGTGTFSVGSVISSSALAAGIYILTNNAKSSFGSFLKNLQALTVYPIVKNQRPLIAGMTGHKGSVYGYEYTEEDMKDSIQGLIVNSVKWVNDTLPFELGDLFMDCFTRKIKDENGNSISEYDAMVKKWSQTLPIPDDDAIETEDESLTSEQRQEVLLQTLHGNVSSEFALRGEYLPSIRTKWRLPSLLVTETDKLADEVYQTYHISNVNTVDDLVTNDKVLELYPIEDELDIKQGVAKSHPNIKELYIVHSQGNAKVQMPFESGNRIIKFFTEKDGSGDDLRYIYDLPMLQEDAITILKLILNDQALKNKKVSFLSGARVNATKTWKSTGFAFVIDAPKSRKAMKNALDNVLNLTNTATVGDSPVFEYKETEKGFVVIVYAPIRKNNN